MNEATTVSAVARTLGVKPRDISAAFYERRLDDSRCPIVRGKRVIPPDYVPEIARYLREVGKLDFEAVRC